jgi:hypothetical protein
MFATTQFTVESGWWWAKWLVKEKVGTMVREERREDVASLS